MPPAQSDSTSSALLGSIVDLSRHRRFTNRSRPLPAGSELADGPYRAIEILTVTGAIYLVLTSCLSALQMYCERLTASSSAVSARAAAGGCAWTRRCPRCPRDRDRGPARALRAGAGPGRREPVGGGGRGSVPHRPPRRRQEHAPALHQLPGGAHLRRGPGGRQARGVGRRRPPPSADLAVARVADRVRLGGHAVSEQTVRRRYRAGLRN